MVGEYACRCIDSDIGSFGWLADFLPGAGGRIVSAAAGNQKWKAFTGMG